MANYKFYITHNSVTSEVFPLYDKLKFSWKKGSVRFRKECKTDFQFINEPKLSRADFTTLLAIETGLLRCNVIDFEIKRSCDKGRTYLSYWNGSFSINAGKFNLNRCTYNVTPSVVDKYSCLLQSQDKDINIIEDTASVITIEMNENLVTVEYAWSATTDTMFNYTLVYTFNYFGVDIYWFFAREVYTTIKIGGISYPPSADPNWSIISSTSTTTTYARPYVGGAVSFTSVLEPFVTCGGDPPPSPATIPGYGEYAFVMCWNPSTTAQSFFIALPTNGLATFTQFHDLLNTINFIVSSICPAITGIVSDFFEWDPIGDAPGYVAGINYVTGTNNTVANLAIAQKSDIINPSATQPATKGLITFKKMMHQLCTIFKVDWFIDSLGNFRIEHEKYFTYTLGFNTTSTPHAQWNGANKIYSYNKDKMPNQEGFKFMESDGVDFDGRDIIYSDACVSTDLDNAGRSDYSADLITTDVNYIQALPDEISKLGFVIVAYYNDGTDNIIHQELGRLSGNVLNNAHLSWANLHYNYHRYGRVLISGNMNGAAETFITAKRNKIQDNVKLQICCGETFDPTGILVQTELGQGEIESAEEVEGIVTMAINL